MLLDVISLPEAILYTPELALPLLLLLVGVILVTFFLLRRK